GITVFCKCKIPQMLYKRFVLPACSDNPKSAIDLFLIVGQELFVEFEKGQLSAFHTEKSIFKFRTVYRSLVFQDFGIALLDTQTYLVKFAVHLLGFPAFA